MSLVETFERALVKDIVDELDWYHKTKDKLECAISRFEKQNPYAFENTIHNYERELRHVKYRINILEWRLREFD